MNPPPAAPMKASAFVDRECGLGDLASRDLVSPLSFRRLFLCFLLCGSGSDEYPLFSSEYCEEFGLAYGRM